MNIASLDIKTINETLNDIGDDNKHEALRYIIIARQSELLEVINIYESFSINPTLYDFIKLLNSFLEAQNNKRKVDLFKWELFCIDREIPTIEEDLKQNIFKGKHIVAT